MAVRVTEIAQSVDLEETHFSYSSDHLIACVGKGRAPGKLFCPRGVVIHAATNQIYVAEGDRVMNFARVSIFSESGEYVNSYTHGDMKSLCGIAIYGNDVYVTDTIAHAVFLLRIGTELRLIDMVGSEGSGIGQFRWPCQLSVSDNGDIFVADSNNHRIQILDSRLHPMREVTDPSMNYPRDVQLATDEIYVLSLTDSPCIHVFSHSGHKTRSLITHGYGKGMQVTKPFFFCLDLNKCLVISDFEADQIRIFSNEGDLLHTIGEQGHQLGMFERPYGLAIMSKSKLVTVSLNINYRLQIFSIF